MAKKKYNLSLYIFRRDLRLYDNNALNKACRESDTVIPSFFFHKDLINPSSDKYRPNLIQFMLESLKELNNTLSKIGSELYLFYNEDFYKGFEKLLKVNNIEAVFINEDITPYSRKRDERLGEICLKNKVDFYSCFDLYLARPDDVLTGEGLPYKVFTSFFNKAKINNIREPIKTRPKNFCKSKVSGQKPISLLSKFLRSENEYLAQRGGRSNSVKILESIEDFKNYEEKRDFPSEPGTTKLSAHLKFGTVSVREFYWAVRNKLGLNSQLITELFWRDFYAHLSYFFPYVFGHSFNKKYEKIKWKNNKRLFDAWCMGKTGFPIVDAGMRQLNKTGWMHNRVRMIVASFLTKDLHVDWRWGEKYFASKLVDYDPASNNGGWQWAASTGADSQPYFRIFNPWRQQEKFDHDALYIKRWLPELAELSPKEIHSLWKIGNLLSSNYPSPIVDHKMRAKQSKIIYQTA